jgi:proteic killer suppression protein
MIRSFKNQGTEDIFNGKNTKTARSLCPKPLWKIAARKLDQIDSVTSLDHLRVPPGNHFEALKRECLGQYSVRINDQYRICFKWIDGSPEDVEVVDYHH